MVYPIAKHVIPTICSPLIGKCKGLANIPNDRGVILAANHQSYFDHILIGCNIVPKLNKPVYFLAKKEHFDTPIQKLWHNYMRAIPLDREAGGKTALKKAIQHLKKGDIIMIYPEGTRTLTGKMNRAKTGIARLAIAARVPVIPMGITNTFQMLPKGKRIPKLGKKADLNIGKPLLFDKYYKSKRTQHLFRKITTVIMHEIAKLAKTKYNFDKDYLE